MRVTLAIEQDTAVIESMLSDYARWDDTVAFIQGNKADYLTSNFTGESVANLHVTSVVITKLDATPILKLTLSSEGTIGDMSADMLNTLTPYFKHISQLAIKEKLTSVLWLNNKPFLMVASPVTDTARKQTASGYMYALRRLDDQYIKRIQKTASIPFTLQPAVARIKQMVIVKQSEENSVKRWTASASLTNLPAEIIVGGPTRLLNERRITYWTLAGIAASLVAFSLVGIYLILNRRILRRLHEFSQLADRHRIDKDSSIRWPIQGKDELDNLSTSLNDLMAEVNARHQDLNFLAEHDPLTGIGNRRQLHNRLEAVQNRSRRQPSLASSLLLLDLDGFKLINDGLGHSVGDKVLQIIANRLLTLSRNYDTVARLGGDEATTHLGGSKTVTRLGGDEFAVLLEDTTPPHATLYAERLLRTLEQPIELEGQNLIIRGSIGITPAEASLTKEEIVRNADLAMYEAKRRGKGQIVMFSVGLLDKAHRRMQLEQALQHAMNSNLLEVWYQPIIAPHSGGVVGMEALSRWTFNENYIPPDEFIGIAETSGMIVQLGRFVLDQAGAALKDLRAEYPNLQCSVNLSVRQFRDTDLVADISACLHKHNLPADALKLELTESMLAEHEEDLLATMLNIVKLGCKFYLDDFGTGYSSLDRLRRFPIEVLKIDRSFVTPLGNGDDVMVRNIINIGHELGMKLIAEGVETETELSRLTELGCIQFQGYYFAKPMPLEDLRIWLASQ